ncbi:MAG: hypothetical protein ABI433_03445 [Burkholderiaceae bacterium]
MTTIHAVSWLDHQSAQVLQFDATQVSSDKIKAHEHYTRQHGSEVRSEHEFFGHVCDALAGIAEVLVTGPKVALADFKHYADKHRPETAKRIVAYETLDHVTENQLLAKARDFFLKYDRMAGTPTPT